MAESIKSHPVSSTDRKKWDHIFNALVQMLRTQQSNVQFLEDRLKFQQDRFVFDVNQFQQQSSQMKRNIKLLEMEQIVEVAKLELFMAVKKTESLMHKLKLENTQSELADFKVWFDLLSSKCSEPNDVEKTANREKNKALGNEQRRFKHENEKLRLRRTSELSALISERDFVRNQCKILEGDLTNKLISKHAELEQANEKIQKILINMEQLEASNSEKEKLIVKFKTHVAELESESLRKSEEISRLSMDLELLKKGRDDSVTPVLRRCAAEVGKSLVRVKKSGVHDSVAVKKEPSSSQIVEKGSKSTKRRNVANNSISEAPRLFTSRFKVPKLKTSSPSII